VGPGRRTRHHQHVTARRWPWATALVTGASSGIGEAIVASLAAGGVGSIVLVARRAEVLAALAGSLPAEVRTEVLPADLATDEGVAAVAARLASAPVDLVVNDAGAAWSGPFLSAPAGIDDSLVRLNVVALTRLTRAGLAPMVERGHGAVLNVASMVAYQPTPGTATYAATKAYVTHLSEALHEELRGTGVTVTALLPGYTRTPMATATLPRWAWLSADAVARAGLTAAARGRALCVPGALYKAATVAVTPVPRSGRRWLMGRLTG
jgi:short-subunit dehydrogenase